MENIDKLNIQKTTSSKNLGYNYYMERQQIRKGSIFQFT